MERFRDLREGALDNWRTKPTQRSIQELEEAEDELEDIEMNLKLDGWKDVTVNTLTDPWVCGMSLGEDGDEGHISWLYYPSDDTWEYTLDGRVRQRGKSLETFLDKCRSHC